MRRAIGVVGVLDLFLWYRYANDRPLAFPHLPPDWAQYAPAVHELYMRKWDRLAPLNSAFINFLAEAFGVTTPVSDAASFAVRDEQTGRLVEHRRHGDTGVQ